MKTNQFLASVAVSTFLAAAAHAVSTTPVGYVTVNIAAGTGTSPTLSVVSFPLLTAEDILGQSRGAVTSVTSSTITNSNAGWEAGALSQAATPYIIKITSGAAEGRTFLISTSTPNTSTTVTVDAQEAATTDLSAIGILSGDTYAIFACDTLSSAFGTPATTGVLGGASPTGVDIVQMYVGGGWLKYYYNTNLNSWRRVGPNTASDNLPIRPDAGVIYSRLAAAPITLTVTGTVPDDNRKSVVANSGVTFLSSMWPVDITLGTSNIQGIPGWVSNASASNADIVQMFVSGGWLKYYYDGTQWKRVGPNTPSNSVSIPVGTSVILSKKGSASGASVLSQNMPYTL